MSNHMRQVMPSRTSQNSQAGRAKEMKDFSDDTKPWIFKDFVPCAATSQMFLYAHNNSIICCRHDSLEIERRFSRHSKEIQLLAVDNHSQHGAGRLVASYDVGQTAIVWDMVTGEEIARFTCYGHMTTATWMRNGSIAFGNSSGRVIQFDPSTSEEKSTMTLSNLPISALAVANDNVTHAIGYYNGTLIVGRIQNSSFILLHTLNNNRPPSPVVTLQWHSASPQQKSTMLAAQMRGGDLRVWSIPKVQGEGHPTTIRHLLRHDEVEEEQKQGANWMAWSKNGRIIGYSENAEVPTLSWDVRTRHISRDVIPTSKNIKGLAVHGPTAVLFTFGPDNTVQQYDLNAPSIMTCKVQHPTHAFPPSPPVSIEEPLTSTSESEIPFNPSDATESEEENGYMGGVARKPAYNHLDNASETVETASQDESMYMRSQVRSKGGHSDHTYISTGTRMTGYGSSKRTAQQPVYNTRARDFRSQSSLNSASTRPQRRALSKQPMRGPDEPSQVELFRFTACRLEDVPYKHHPVVDGVQPTNEELRQQMLGTIFGWNGSVRDLILDEMARHKRGSSVRIMLSKWIDLPISDEEVMSCTELRTASDWMLLALGGIGSQPSQQKLGRVYISKLLAQGELHAAVTIMLVMGDHNDAIEVYYSHKHYLEALILTCLFNPTVWERQSAIVKKWGEWAIQHGKQQLAIRCFACNRESNETWKSPSAQQLTFQSLNADMFSPPMSPPPTRTPQRNLIKSSALTLITSFGESNQSTKFFGDDYDGKTPIAGQMNTKGLHIPAESDIDPTTAILRPSTRSTFNTPTSVRSHTSGTSAFSRKRLESIGEVGSSSRRDPSQATARAHPPPPPPPQQQLGPDFDVQSNFSAGMSMSRAATASPMMMRDDFRRLVTETTMSPSGFSNTNTWKPAGPHHMRTVSNNSGRTRMNHLNLNIDTGRAQEVDEVEGGILSARYHWPRRRGPSSVSSVTSASTTSKSKKVHKNTMDSYANGIDAVNDYRRGHRAASRERSRGPSRERTPMDMSRDRGRSVIRIPPSKRSPKSPVPMSPEDLVNLKAKAAASLDAAANKRSMNMSSRSSNRGSRSRSRTRGMSMSMSERGMPLTISGMQIISRNQVSTGFKSPTSPTPMSAFIPNLSGSEDELDYQLAIADKENFRQARSASRTSRGKTPDILETADKQLLHQKLESQLEQQRSELRRQTPEPFAASHGGSRRGSFDHGSHSHAGDLRKHREDRQRKKEIAARELEERRRELVIAQAGPILHPSELIPEPISRPGTASSQRRRVAQETPRSASTDIDPRPMKQSLVSGYPATPKAMKLVHPPLDLQWDQKASLKQDTLPSTSFISQRRPSLSESRPSMSERGPSASERRPSVSSQKTTPPPAIQDVAQRQSPPQSKLPPAATTGEKPAALRIERNIHVVQPPATAALPSTQPSGESNGLTLLPSTVYQPPGKSIPRCQSAPIPDEPSYLRRSQSISRQPTRPRQESISNQDRGRSPAPAVLKELQHLVSPKPSVRTFQHIRQSSPVPPPPPPPPPMGIPIPATPNPSVTAGDIEIVENDPDTPAPARAKTTSPSTTFYEPITIPPNDMMVPVLSPPQPRKRGQSRGRSSADHGFSSRLSEATERLRSGSRSRKDNPTRAMGDTGGVPGIAPYESVMLGGVQVNMNTLPTGLNQKDFF